MVKFKQMLFIYVFLPSLFVFRDGLEFVFFVAPCETATKENRECVTDGHILAVSVMWDNG